MNEMPTNIVREGFAELLGVQMVEHEPDRVVVRLPYKPDLGVGRIHGGAISALVDIAATAAFWSHPSVGKGARGATVGFTINFLTLAVGIDLTAVGTVRRRGGTLCTGEVVVKDDVDREIAIATVTYKLSTGSK